MSELSIHLLTYSYECLQCIHACKWIYHYRSRNGIPASPNGGPGPNCWELVRRVVSASRVVARDKDIIPGALHPPEALPDTMQGIISRYGGPTESDIKRHHDVPRKKGHICWQEIPEKLEPKGTYYRRNSFHVIFFVIHLLNKRNTVWSVILRTLALCCI